MVRSCVAYGCSNEHDPRKQISFHTFPFKRPEILERWITAVRREAWYPSKSSRLCGAHFVPSDYQERPGCKMNLLKLDAVPSIFSFSQHLSKNYSYRRKVLRQNVDLASVKAAEEAVNINDSPKHEAKLFKDVENQTTLNISHMQREDDGTWKHLQEQSYLHALPDLEYVSVEENLVTIKTEIVEPITDVNLDHEVKVECCEVFGLAPTKNEAMDALDTIRRYFNSLLNVPNTIFQHLDALNNFMETTDSMTLPNIKIEDQSM